MSRDQRQGSTLRYFLGDTRRASKVEPVRLLRKRRWGGVQARHTLLDNDWDFVHAPVFSYRSNGFYEGARRLLYGHVHRPELEVRKKISQLRPKYMQRQIYDWFIFPTMIINDEVYVRINCNWHRVGDMYGSVHNALFFCPIRKTLEDLATANQPTFHERVAAFLE